MKYFKYFFLAICSILPPYFSDRMFSSRHFFSNKVSRKLSVLTFPLSDFSNVSTLVETWGKLDAVILAFR